MNRKAAQLSLVLCGLGMVLLQDPVANAENRAYLIQFYKRFDKNSDGRLDPREWKSNRLAKSVERAIRDAGFDPEQSVSLEKLVDARLKKSDRSRKDERTDGAYRSKIGHQRLDKNVPDWFRQRDKDENGQVAMSEFASDWTDNLVADFLKFDVNRDGVITPAESLGADSSGSAASSDARYGTRSNTPTSGLRTASSSASDKSSTATTKSSGSAGSTESVEGISPAYLSYSKDIIKKYDKNEDGVLTKSEWSEMSKNPADADTNGDHRITFVEYARWVSK